MKIPGLDVDSALSMLKDFQRRTVDYVFRRFYYDDPPALRFLVADEVGLGKTLVARGIIARTLEHLADKVDRIDVVYVCSNTAIAQQNINRLNILGDQQFELATRLTLLPAQLHSLTANRVNFVSFTPGTSFDLRSRGGRGSERVLLHRLLCDLVRGPQSGLRNVLQATMSAESFRRLLDRGVGPLNETLAARFRDRLAASPKLLRRLDESCYHFRRRRSQWPTELRQLRLGVIGELRELLAHTCIDALEPDLVILDEFQRFKQMLHGAGEAAELARTLMQYRDPQGHAVRVLLLSATPYQPLTYDDDDEDNHYRDFTDTLRFLFESPEDVTALEEDLRRYRRALFGSAELGVDEPLRIRDAVQGRLLSVMTRTERVASTAERDAMVTTPFVPTNVAAADLRHARLVGGAAQVLGSHDPMEYWKSAPYLLHFMKEYDLKDRLEAAADRPDDALLQIMQSADSVLLRRRTMDRYRPLEPASGRLRALLDETIERGMWRMLWLPPSLPYVQQQDSESIRHLTKALVFSSWNVVPGTLAALLSYEAERRMVLALEQPTEYRRLFNDRKPLLRFSMEDRTRETGMPVLALLYPCVTLARSVDPLRIAAGRDVAPPRDEIRLAAQRVIETALKAIDVEFAVDGGADPQWYWAAPALLDCRHHPDAAARIADGDEWQVAISEDHDPTGALARHIARFNTALRGEIVLGRPPDDLVEVLTDLALGAPAVVALRALGRLGGEECLERPAMQDAAAHIAGGFRTLYNLPQTISLLRADDENAYWRVVAQHAADGDLQAVLDEYFHSLRESLGMLHQPIDVVAPAIAEEAAAAVAIRTSNVEMDEILVSRRSGRIRFRPFRFRSRFALRFSELKDDDGQRLARVGVVKQAFNSPFRPFVLATTSIGQEGLDFHPYCHAVYHWNLPSNPVDMEQREGRVHRYKGHAVRKNVALRFGLRGLAASTGGDPWTHLFELAASERPAGASELVPYWIYPVEGGATVERRVPMLPFSREQHRIRRLQQRLAVYRLAFGQPRQEDLLAYLEHHGVESGLDIETMRIRLEPPGAASA